MTTPNARPGFEAIWKSLRNIEGGPRSWPPGAITISLSWQLWDDLSKLSDTNHAVDPAKGTLFGVHVKPRDRWDYNRIEFTVTINLEEQ